MGRSTLVVAAVLLQIALLVAAHGDEGHDGSMNMDMGGKVNQTDEWPEPYDDPNYARFPGYSTWLLLHVIFMVVSWVFVLPVGVMFSIVRSRLTLPVQFLFLILNCLGVIFGTVYNVNTPALYENNAHHKIGWIATWVMAAQVAMTMLFVYSGKFKKTSAPAAASERAAFLPVSVESMAQHNMRPYSDYRWSGDSGQGTERSSTQTSRDVSPTDAARREEYSSYTKPEAEPENDDEGHDEIPQRRGILRNKFFHKYLAARVPALLSSRPFNILTGVHNAIDRSIILLGFIALTTGGVTYAGIFRNLYIFGGLAHFVKGGIFFWYGLLTLGRWMGSFSTLGWSWNIKPNTADWRSRAPSAEFVESFVIFLYGITNVFLEHLGAWGGAWSASDLEHVSITIMFAGGGLCGMLVESKRIRDCLNISIDLLPEQMQAHKPEAEDLRAPPKTYGIPMNPIPALIILLLGIMMSSHHQDSVVSTKVHAQWGTLLMGFSLARAVTYIITYISPPTSNFPSRPPSELVAAFCLMSGGIVFMASVKDITYIMEVKNIMAMFVFTVTMGLTSFLMAWTIVVLALKGWAERREMRDVVVARY